MLTDGQLSCLGLSVSGDFAGLTTYTTRQGKIVAYHQSPPTKPLSVWQLAWQRNFKVGMALWSRLDPLERMAYRRVCDLASLCMLGHNLWLHVFLAADYTLLETLASQYRIPLTAPPRL